MDNTSIYLLLLILLLVVILIAISYNKKSHSQSHCKLTPNRYNYVPQPNSPSLPKMNYMNLMNLSTPKEKFASINNYSINSINDSKTERKMTLDNENKFDVPKYNMIECEGPNCGANITGPYPLPCDDSKKDKSVFIKCSNMCGKNSTDNKTINSLDDIDPETLKILLMNKYITSGLEVIERQ